jgi:hypothetical protein
MKYHITEQRLYTVIGMILAMGLYGLTFWLALAPRKLPASQLEIKDFQTIFVFGYIALIGIAFLFSRRFPSLVKGFLVGSVVSLVFQGLVFATAALMNV